MFPPLLKPGTDAPDFRLLDQHSHSISRQELTGRRGLVLLFFTTGRFGPDERLLKTYRDAEERLQAAGLNVAALSAANWETLHHLTQRLNLAYPVLFDACARVAMRYGAVIIPRFVTGPAVALLDGEGRICLLEKGFVDPDAVLAAL